MPPSSSSSSSRNCRFLQPHLPDECWESIFKHLTNPHDHESLSLVSRHFLSITNTLRTSLTVSDHLLPLLPALLRRFTSLTTIKLNCYIDANIDALLSQIASFDLPSLYSLDISYQNTFPSHGLRQFSQKFPTLKSLNCSYARPDLGLIAECFPNLEEIDVSFPQRKRNMNREWGRHVDFNVKALASGLKKLRKVNISGICNLRDPCIFNLCQNCKFLEEIVVLKTYTCSKQSQIDVANAIRERPQLRSLAVNFLNDGLINEELRRDNVTSKFIDALLSLKGLTCLDLSASRLSDEALCALAEGGLPLRKLSLPGCKGYGYRGISRLLRMCINLQCLDLQSTDFLNDECVIELSLLLGNLQVVKLSGNAKLTDLSLFAIMRNCPLITEIRMENTDVGKKKLQEDCLVVNSHLKFLYLGDNSGLDDESVTMLASVCPNLEMIDLTYCTRVSEGAIDVLRRCCKIQRMDLAYLGYHLSRFQFRVNFEVPTLFVLNLSWCRISDEELSLISESCYRLKEVNLEYCDKITNKGIEQMVKNCKQLRMISLDCAKVTSDIFEWMVLVRPSLRKIIPPRFTSPIVRDRLLRHGCVLGYK